MIRKGLLLPIAVATLLTSACGSKPPIPEPVGTLTVSVSALSFTDASATQTLSVTANCDWGVGVENKDWCSVTPSGGVSGTSTVTLKVQENNSFDTRTNALTFRYDGKALEVPITQTGKERPTPPEGIVIPDGYVLDWNDEFEGENGSLPDGNLWRFENKPAGWVNHELQTYVPGSRNGIKTAFLEDGVLNIRAAKDGNDVISARIYSKKSWTYGYMEAAIWLPKGKGTWPAFWMMPDDFSRGWPGCGEIDIMEEVGYHANYTSSSIHCMKYYHAIGTQKTHEQYMAGAEEGYHVYGLEWTPDALKFYLDRKLHFTYSNDKKNDDDTWPFNKNFYLILNLAWGGDWGGSQGVDPSALPCTMKVAYVRVFKKQ